MCRLQARDSLQGIFSAGDLWYPKLLLSNRSALNKSSHLFHLRISDTHTTNYDHEYQDIYGVFHPANRYVFEVPKIDTSHATAIFNPYTIRCLFAWKQHTSAIDCNTIVFDSALSIWCQTQSCGIGNCHNLKLTGYAYFVIPGIEYRKSWNMGIEFFI